MGERLQRLDEEAAEVVRHIFSLTLEGYGPYNSYFAPGMLLYAGWLKFIIHISFLALFEKENYNVRCGGAKGTI